LVRLAARTKVDIKKVTPSTERLDYSLELSVGATAGALGNFDQLHLTPQGSLLQCHDHQRHRRFCAAAACSMARCEVIEGLCPLYFFLLCETNTRARQLKLQRSTTLSRPCVEHHLQKHSSHSHNTSLTSSRFTSSRG